MTLDEKIVEAIKQSELTPIQISKETHRMAKEHCERHGLKLGQWTDKIIREFLTGKLARVSPIVDIEELSKQ